MDTTPAKSLNSKKLNGGWTVIERIDRKAGTGGHFSIGYIVVNEHGKKAFLKAMDFSGALQTEDPSKSLQQMLEAYNFERDLLKKCSKLDKIVTPITDGHAFIEGFGLLSAVPYLIFEKAVADVREYISTITNFDIAWCLRSLHHIAVGMKQLHTNNIAHQDLKPSNVLFFDMQGFKIGDLGRASSKEMSAPHDLFRIAGDCSYAAPELHYKDAFVDGFEKRILSDLYLLGSMIFFYFTNVSAAQALRAKIQGNLQINIIGDSFTNDLPYWKHAFAEALIDLEIEVAKTAGNLKDEIVYLAKQLCEPDPRIRGDWKSTNAGNVYRTDLQRIISKLDLLAKKAEHNLL